MAPALRINLGRSGSQAQTLMSPDIDADPLLLGLISGGRWAPTTVKVAPEPRGLPRDLDSISFWNFLNSATARQSREEIAHAAALHAARPSGWPDGIFVRRDARTKYHWATALPANYRRSGRWWIVKPEVVDATWLTGLEARALADAYAADPLIDDTALRLRACAAAIGENDGVMSAVLWDDEVGGDEIEGA